MYSLKWHYHVQTNTERPSERSAPQYYDDYTCTVNTGKMLTNGSLFENTVKPLIFTWSSPGKFHMTTEITNTWKSTISTWVTISNKILVVLRRTREKQLKETWWTWGHEPTLPSFVLILDLMRTLVNHWSPLTHASHCTTTSWPAAATQTRLRVSTAMHLKVFLCLMPFLPQSSLFPGLGTISDNDCLLLWSRNLFNNTTVTVSHNHDNQI